MVPFRFFAGNITKDEIVLQRNKLLTVLPYLGREFKISFDLFITKYGTPKWNYYYSRLALAWSIIHFTLGGDMENEGDRIPGIFIYPKTKVCQIWMNWNIIHDVKTELQEKKWINFEISQTLINKKAGRQVEGKMSFVFSI